MGRKAGCRKPLLGGEERRVARPRSGCPALQKLDSIGLAMVAQQAPNGHQSNGAIGGLPAATSSAHSAQLEALQDANVQLVQARDDLARRVMVLEAEAQDAAKAAETAASLGTTVEGSAAERAQVIADTISKARAEAYAEGEAAGTETATTAAAQLAQEAANAHAAQVSSLETRVTTL